jgi:hypothetical protein
MLRRVALVRTNVSEELIASFIRVTRNGELGTMLAVTSNRRTLRRNNRSWHFFAVCPSAHPNDLAVNLMTKWNNKRVQRHLSSDLPIRFIVYLPYL